MTQQKVQKNRVNQLSPTTALIKGDTQGFTLIEVLMAVILVAILATLALTQYMDFSKDAKNASVKGSLRIMREGIQRAYGVMRVRCNVTSASQFPTHIQVQRNTIEDDAANTANDDKACGTAELTGFSTDLPSSPTLDANDELTFSFGAKLVLRSGRGGNYRGRIPITVDYN